MAGLAVYSSLSIYNLQRQLGVVGVTDTQYTGSANAYLASTPYASAAQKLYAYKFQRNCASAPNNGGPFCASVPSSGFVPGRLHAGPGADQHDGRRLLRGPCVR